MPSTRLTTFWGLIILTTGCTRDPGAEGLKPLTPPPAASSAGATSASQPSATPAQPPAGGGIAGEVLETMSSGGYTYVKLKTASGEVWAAVPQTKVQKGARVAIAGATAMQNFKSRTLDRTFEVIYFGQLAGKGGEKAGGATAKDEADTKDPKDTKAAEPSKAQERQPTQQTIAEKIARAPGPSGRTIAEVYAQRAALSGKKVKVRGKVVKFTGGIMGRNWMHLQDGTGQKGTHDLTVTTASTDAKVGQVVVVEGKLATDKDFGAGYRYAAILEDATIDK